jgi:hypothetical protein
LRDLQTKPLTTDDLNGALVPMLTRRVLGYESSFTRGMHYVEWILGAGTSNYLRKDIERYQVTPAQVLGVAARALPLDRRVISIVTPDPTAPPSGVLQRKTFKAPTP